MKNKLINFLILTFATAITFCVTEVVYRKILFSKFKFAKAIQSPAYYASYFYDDYWKVLYKLNGAPDISQKITHPYLGWVGNFDKKTLLHNDTLGAEKKRKILLFGDSYAHCVTENRCFQDFINNDTTLNKNFWLLNYGVNGYGVDQIGMLMDSVVGKYQNPFVIFSVMPEDMDRSVLSVRTGPKPFYKLINDSLVLSGVPVDTNPKHYFENNPAEIKSYFFNRIKFSRLNPFLKDYGRDNENRNRILTLNEAILKKAVKTLKQKKLEYIFLLYESPGGVDGAYDGEWRIEFLESFCKRNNLVYLKSSDLIHNNSLYQKFGKNFFYIRDNLHPTAYYNMIVSDEIKKHLKTY